MRFSLIVPRRPPSSNKGRNAKFQNHLRAQAKAKHQGQAPLHGRLYCRIVWFHTYATTQDVDSIAKNILDSFKGVVYQDDVTVTRCLLVKVDTRNEDYEIGPERIAEDEYNLLKGLVRGGAERENDVLYLEVGPATGQWVNFGPIEEKSI
jgi:hypothetical protein